MNNYLFDQVDSETTPFKSKYKAREILESILKSEYLE